MNMLVICHLMLFQTYADISEESGDSDEPNEDTFFIDMEIANEHVSSSKAFILEFEKSYFRSRL